MSKKESPLCKDETREIAIKKDIFEREIAICQSLCKENNGSCNWGKCKDCGVIFLLNKLYKGELIEEKEEVKQIKKKILKI